MADINHRVGIKATPEKIYQLLTTDDGLEQWWTTDTSGAGALGSVIRFRFGDSGPDFKVIELKPNKLVRWQHFGTMPEAWMETEIVFTLEADPDQTFVHFKHANWSEVSSFMGHCSMKWAIFLLSLKDAAETGKGKPYPDDIQIDHN